MPALNIYVTEDLKNRMNKANANWSEVCRHAIEIELLRLEGRTPSNIDLGNVKEWISEYLDPNSVHSDVVVKPYLHKEDKTKNEVKVLSDFYTGLISELNNFRLNILKGSLGDLLEGKHRADILFPGRGWSSGNLGIKLELYFNSPKTPDIVEAEIVVDTKNLSLVQSELSSLIHVSSSELDMITQYVDIESEIIEYKVENFDVPEFPSDIYSILRKTWKNLYGNMYSNPPKPPKSNIIKDLWRKWYSPQVQIESENWSNNWNNRRKDPKYTYEWENIVAAFYFALNDEEFDPSFSEIPEDCELLDGCDSLFLSFIEFISKFVFDGVLLDLIQINVSELSSVLISERDELPEQSGIYFVTDESETIHYIGMSINLRNRWYSHHRQEDFDLIENGKIAYISSMPKHYLKEIEATLIKTFIPRLNLKGKPKIFPQ
jgi:hypothetical protein